jgi:predicted nucleotide-binding protein
MPKIDRAQLGRKRSNLARLRDLLFEQEAALTKSWDRSQGWEGASDSQMAVLRELFEEVHNTLTEKNIRFVENNGFDGLQAQIISVRSKINEALADIESSLGLPASALPYPQNIPTSPQQSLPDPRSIFVVYGRNSAIRRSMFDFLRAIGLSPIEWDDAIAMTGQGAPYTGYAIDTAFSNAHAALILITGDDLACLKPEFILDDDEDSERKPTPQARPNVIFEMGLAFGKKPDRTIIVEFGKTRLISDTLGRNVIRFSDTSEFRHKLAGRLRTAGCAVNMDSKSDWLSSKFDFPPSGPKSTTDVRFQITHDKISERARTREYPQTRAVRQPSGFPDAPPTDGELEHLFANRREEFIASSPDHFSIKINRYEDDGVKGLLITTINNGRAAIKETTIRILSAQSFNPHFQDYRDSGSVRVFQWTDPNVIDASFPGKGISLIRKVESVEHLFLGNDNGHQLIWPPLDDSVVHRWLLSIDVVTKTAPKNNLAVAQGLAPIKIKVVAVWNKEVNEFFIEDAPSGT